MLADGTTDPEEERVLAEVRDVLELLPQDVHEVEQAAGSN